MAIEEITKTTTAMTIAAIDNIIGRLFGRLRAIMIVVTVF
jgi:hypothetical protein